MKKNLSAVFLLLSVLFLVPLGSSASTFSNLVVFGDSLSDNGNVGRFTDGPIWVETLAGSLGANLFDYAFGGATTGFDNPAASSPALGLQWQIDAFAGMIMDETLVSVWAGANDFLQVRSPGLAANNIGIALNKLYDAGARDILVGNLPDMGLTPSLYNSGLQGPASEWTSGFNYILESVLLNFEAIYTDANLYVLDAYSVFADFSPGTQEWLDLFWNDGFHPSSVGHQLIYETAAAVVAPVPEPSTVLLLGSGLAGLALYGRKKRVAE